MRWLRNPIKLAWYARRLVGFTIRWWFFRLLQGSYLASLGMGTRFYGWPRFGTVEGNIHVGRQCHLGAGLMLSAGPACQIHLGDRVSLNTGCHLVALYGITIGEGTRIGEYTSIRDQNHRFDEPGTVVDQGYVGAPIRIEADCWIGRGVFIGPGVTIGRGAVIGANSVVTRDIPADAVAVGAPARVVRYRNESDA
jgi:acetyltransferase-like isoleucine patch superfamily enzyme